MKRKTFPKKLVLNKTTIATLSSTDLGQVNGGIIGLPVPISVGCVYTVGCTNYGCADSVAGADTCIYTNFGDMMGCPETMTLCGELYCP